MNVFDTAPAALESRTTSSPARKVFRMERNERMAGSVPAWGTERTARETVTAKIASVAGGSNGNPTSALAYSDHTQHFPSGSVPREFGFGDILDMINPLHHIPVVGTLYRHMTGDEIQPVSRIMGGALYGGGAGAASGLVNLIVETETGRDIPGNIAAMARGEAPELKNLEGTTLAYANLGAEHNRQGRYNS